MISWAWLLLIVPLAGSFGFLMACLLAASRMSNIKGRLLTSERGRIGLANTLRRKCLEVEWLRRRLKKAEKK